MALKKQAHQHTQLCGPGCRYRALYEGTQSSLADLAAKQAIALNRLGRLRQGLVLLLRAASPRQFADLEDHLGMRISEVDDESLLSCAQWLLEQERDGTELAELRDALAAAGYRVAPTDGVADLARAVVRGAAYDLAAASAAAMPGAVPGALYTQAPARLVRRTLAEAAADAAAKAQPQTPAAVPPATPTAPATPVPTSAEPAPAAATAAPVPVPVPVAGTVEFPAQFEPAVIESAGARDLATDTIEPTDSPALAFGDDGDDDFDFVIGDVEAPLEPEPEPAPQFEPEPEPQPAPPTGVEPVAAQNDLGGSDTGPNPETASAGAFSSPAPPPGWHQATGAPATPAAATPAEPKPLREVRGTPVRPELFPSAGRSSTLPARRRRRSRVSATAPENLDIPTAAVAPPPAPADGLDDRLMAATAIPRPVFVADLAALAGSGEAVEAWIERCRADDASSLRFIPPKARHRLRGSLVLPTGALRDAAVEFDDSWWAECMRTFRGAKLYELAVLLHGVGDRVVSWRVAPDHSTVLLRLNEPRGVVGVVVVLNDSLAADEPARTQLAADVGELLRDRLELLVVLVTAEPLLEPAITALSEDATANGWRPACHVVAARSWEWAVGDAGAARHVLG